MQNALFEVLTFIHKYVSVPTSLKTGNNGADPDLRHDDITKMWAGFKPTGQSETLLSETMRRVQEVIWSVFPLAC